MIKKLFVLPVLILMLAGCVEKKPKHETILNKQKETKCNNKDKEKAEKRNKKNKKQKSENQKINNKDKK